MMRVAGIASIVVVLTRESYSSGYYVTSEIIEPTEEELQQIKEHTPYCVRAFMDTLFQKTSFDPKKWGDLYLAPLGHDPVTIEKAEMMLGQEWSDSGAVLLQWETTYVDMIQELDRIYFDPKSSWKMSEMVGVEDCKRRFPEEMPTTDCQLNFVGGHDAQPLAKGSYSAVFVAHPGPGCQGYPQEVVVKYSNNCKDRYRTPQERYEGKALEDADEAALEFAILKVIEPKNIAPRVYSISAPTVPDVAEAWKYDRRLIVDQKKSMEACENQKAIVRAIVQDRIYKDIREFVKSMIMDLNRMKFAIRSGLKIVQHLMKLHDAGFTHGDLHGGNIAVRDNLGAEIALIDFGLAEYFPTRLGSDPKIESVGNLNPKYLSHWHLEHHRLGRRDDIFRAIEITARLLLSDRVFESQLGGVYVWDKTIEFKRAGMYFTTGYGENMRAVCNLYPNVHGCNAAMAKLDEALQIIRTTPHPDARPKYQDILLRFNQALAALE
jgi:hypothetical protein